MSLVAGTLTPPGGRRSSLNGRGAELDRRAAAPSRPVYLRSGSAHLPDSADRLELAGTKLSARAPAQLVR